ncbi:MAG: 16S rRNA (uracil(1498)-N(3))-methyltransferase [Ignavibacteria bacterium]|nr:16S rRNA (uracil(1498)-N(3))-methyltransferase [Ignavibacteria bacterium]
MEHLSNIELFYTSPNLISEKEILLSEDEFKHAVKVMRNAVGNDLFITNGKGDIFQTKISVIKKNELIAEITDQFKYKNQSEKIIFCIPKLKNPDRLKYAIEKSVELGITNFKIFESKYTISKSSNIKRLQKIALAAMKQSIRSFLPQIEFDTLEDILESELEVIIFNQNAKNKFKVEDKYLKPAHFIFGPEGGFAKSELKKFIDVQTFKLAHNRLRTETAIVKCASLLSIP